jgi:hypothetical protein
MEYEAGKKGCEKGSDKKQKKTLRSYQNRQVEVVCNRRILMQDNPIENQH